MLIRLLSLLTATSPQPSLAYIFDSNNMQNENEKALHGVEDTERYGKVVWGLADRQHPEQPGDTYRGLQQHL